jgi:hypothetical protein
MSPHTFFYYHTSLVRCVPWSMCLLDDASLGRCVSRMMRLLDDASLGRCVSWTTRPLYDASLTGGGGGLTLCWVWSGHFGQGRFVQGRYRLRDASSKGRNVQGTYGPGKNLRRRIAMAWHQNKVRKRTVLYIERDINRES